MCWVCRLRCMTTEHVMFARSPGWEACVEMTAEYMDNVLAYTYVDKMGERSLYGVIVSPVADYTVPLKDYVPDTSYR